MVRYKKLLSTNVSTLNLVIISVKKIVYKITKKLTVTETLYILNINYKNHVARYVAIDRSKSRSEIFLYEPNCNHRSVTFEKRFI